MPQDIYSRMGWLTPLEQAYLRQYERHSLNYYGWLDFEMFAALVVLIPAVDQYPFMLHFGQMFASLLQQGLLPLLEDDLNALQRFLVSQQRWSYHAKERLPQIYPALLRRFHDRLDEAARAALGLDALLDRLPYQIDADIRAFVAALPYSRARGVYRPPVGVEVVQRLIRYIEDEL